MNIRFDILKNYKINSKIENLLKYLESENNELVIDPKYTLKDYRVPKLHIIRMIEDDIILEMVKLKNERVKTKPAMTYNEIARCLGINVNRVSLLAIKNDIRRSCIVI